MPNLRANQSDSPAELGGTIRTLVTIAAVSLLSLAFAASAQATAVTSVASNQPTVALLGAHTVRLKPDSKRKVVARVSSSRPITGQRTKMPVLARKTDARGKRWLRVRLPGRALGQPSPPRTGWISASNAMRSNTTWHLVVDRSSREVMVYRSGRQVHSYKVIIGAPATPTPRGNFFVEESVRLPANAAGAPYALALSARSSVFQEFEGGPGQVAIHGINNIGGELGTAVSHGCIRASSAGISWMAKRIGQGVPVTIQQ